jgi:hypothetical protein
VRCGKSGLRRFRIDAELTTRGIASFRGGKWQLPNREKPFTDALRVALLSGGGRRLRMIADKLADKAEQGDIQAIREIADRLDGKPAQAIERGYAPLEAMTDQQLFAIIRGGPPEPMDTPSYPMIEWR